MTAPLSAAAEQRAAALVRVSFLTVTAEGGVVFGGNLQHRQELLILDF